MNWLMNSVVITRAYFRMRMIGGNDSANPSHSPEDQSIEQVDMISFIFDLNQLHFRLSSLG